MSDLERVEELRKRVREVVRHVIDEMTDSSATPGFLTPNAFRGNSKFGKKRQREKSEKSGYALTPIGKSSVNRDADRTVSEGKSYYRTYKNDPGKTSRQKIGLSLRELKRSIASIHRELEVVSRFKNEEGISSENYWKRTLKDIYRIEGQLVKISQKLREIRT